MLWVLRAQLFQNVRSNRLKLYHHHALPHVRMPSCWRCGRNNTNGKQML